MGDLAQQLQVEAGSRPPDALKAEAVLDALTKEGLPIGDRKQFVARTVLAKYCYGGMTAKATTVTVCEYADAAAATKGLQHSEKQFAAIPNRTLTQNKGTVLTLVRGLANDETKADADKAIAIFSKL